MNRRFVRILMLFVLVILTGKAQTQDVTLSQFMANPLFTNPALAGFNLGPRASIAYRNQWPSLKADFVSYTASYDQNVEFLNSGFGASFLSTKIGGDALTTAVMSGYYAYQFQTSKHLRLSIGLRGSYFQKQLNWNLVNSSTDYDTIKALIGVGSGEPTTTINDYDIAIGAAFEYKENLFGGLSLEHINTPNVSFYSSDTLNLGMKVSFFAGGNIDIRKKTVRGTHYTPIIISPSIYFQARTGFQQVSMGSMLSRGMFFTGAWYRKDFNNEGALVALLGANYKQFSIGYSFDYSISTATNFDGGAHEITVSFQVNNGLHKKYKSTKLGPVPSPRFK